LHIKLLAFDDRRSARRQLRALFSNAPNSPTVYGLGGPVGFYWPLRHPGRVPKLIILNTLVLATPIPPSI
jgi:hypothetical protein